MTLSQQQRVTLKYFQITGQEVDPIHIYMLQLSGCTLISLATVQFFTLKTKDSNVITTIYVVKVVVSNMYELLRPLLCKPGDK